MDIKGKVALVTGGSSGLGLAAVELLVAKGAKVMVADLQEGSLHSFPQEQKQSIGFIKTDVTISEDNQAAVRKTMDTWGHLDILINCAGIGPIFKTINKNGPVDLALFQQVIDVNLVGSYDCLRLAAWEMAQNDPCPSGERGVIINISSILASQGQLGMSAYAASKGAITSMTAPIAIDLSRNAIRVCGIAPGAFETPMMNVPEPIVKAIVKQVSYPNRMGNPDEFAFMICHIIENSYLNGVVLPLDGGMQLRIR